MTTMGQAMCWSHKIEGGEGFVDGIAWADAVKKRTSVHGICSATNRQSSLCEEWGVSCQKESRPYMGMEEG